MVERGTMFQDGTCSLWPRLAVGELGAAPGGKRGKTCGLLAPVSRSVLLYFPTVLIVEKTLKAWRGPVTLLLGTLNRVSTVTTTLPQGIVRKIPKRPRNCASHRLVASAYQLDMTAVSPNRSLPVPGTVGSVYLPRFPTSIILVSCHWQESLL